MALPNPGLQVDEGWTALVITAPQNDFLSPLGVTWKSRFLYSKKSDWRENRDLLHGVPSLFLRIGKMIKQKGGKR